MSLNIIYFNSLLLLCLVLVLFVCILSLTACCVSKHFQSWLSLLPNHKRSGIWCTKLVQRLLNYIPADIQYNGRNSFCVTLFNFTTFNALNFRVPWYKWCRSDTINWTLASTVVI